MSIHFVYIHSGNIKDDLYCIMLRPNIGCRMLVSYTTYLKPWIVLSDFVVIPSPTKYTKTIFLVGFHLFCQVVTVNLHVKPILWFSQIISIKNKYLHNCFFNTRCMSIIIFFSSKTYFLGFKKYSTYVEYNCFVKSNFGYESQDFYFIL